MKEKTDVMHWADSTAKRIIAEKGDKKKYVIAAGVTPSGTVHIGNFREIITQEIVGKGLESLGKDVRFIYSWDDYDVFRKVPVNMPQKDLLKSYLRRPITDVPDTFDCNHENYARHNELPIEDVLPIVGINAEFIYQNKQYKKCVYADEIKKALEETDKIKEVLNRHRKEPLEDTWLPISIFCEKCGKDTIKHVEYLGDYNLKYECECSYKDTFDFRKKGIVKLLWRIDWPMRWYHEKVDFESAGKDHFAAGGSRDTCAEIVKAVWGIEPPVGFMYEWISIKGGGQFSSSKGNVITVQDVLEVYEPSILRWLFASTRPNAEFAISFDLDVLKYYEDFDKCERIYYKKEKADEKEFNKQSRIYELSAVKLSKNMPFQPSLRHLTNIYQLNQGNFNKIKEYYEEDLKTKEDEERLKLRFNCASNWIKKYAPEDFKFELQDKVTGDVKKQLSKEQIKALKAVAETLKKKKFTEESLFEEFYAIVQENKLEVKDFFKAAYLVLVNKERGPKLAPFVLAIGKNKVIDLFGKL